MAEFVIEDKDLTGLKGKVVIVTGGSSGIGLATVHTLLQLGASVVNGDIRPPAKEPEGSFTFVKTDVTVWADQVALFKRTKETYGRIDHVFANAGLGPREKFLSTELDENGDLKEPDHLVLDVGLRGIINTATLGIYYIRQQSEGGSIVTTSSTTAMQRFRAPDYASGKHGVLGFGRAIVPVLKEAGLPIRVNSVAPSWTESNVLPDLKGLLGSIGVPVQPASAVARAVALLMADTSRNGQLVQVLGGKYKEVDEAVLLPAFKSINGADYLNEDMVYERLNKAKKGTTGALI